MNIQNTARKNKLTASRGKGRPTKEESLKLRRRLLKVATKEFLMWGYTAANIDRIAKDSKIGKMTIYRHFSSKERLFRAAVINVSDRVEHDFANVKQDNRNVREVIHDFVTLSYDDPASEEMLGITRILIAEAKTFPDLVYTIYQQRREMIKPLTDYLKKMSEKGILRFENAELAAFQLVALASGGIRALMIPREAIERSREIWIESAVEVFLNGTICPSPRKNSLK